MSPYRHEQPKRHIWTLIVLFAFGFPFLSAVAQDAPHRGLNNDTDSHTCLGCHDGVLARDTVSHPIGMDYTAASLQSKGMLKPFTALPAFVRLEDGRVGCISCHDTSSSLPAKLTTSNEGSALCFACHNL